MNLIAAAKQALEALAELVALRALKYGIQCWDADSTTPRSRMLAWSDDYDRRKPLAWGAARTAADNLRAALAQAEQAPVATAAIIAACEHFEKVVVDYLHDYELDDGENCPYRPNEAESNLICDAVRGLLADEEFVSTFNAWQDLVRQAISPVAQPVAQAEQAEPDPNCKHCHGTGVDGDCRPDGSAMDVDCVCLFRSSAPQQRTPLSDEQKLQTVAENLGAQYAAWEGIGARDVEHVLRESARMGLTALSAPSGQAEQDPVAWEWRHFIGNPCVIKPFWTEWAPCTREQYELALATPDHEGRALCVASIDASPPQRTPLSDERAEKWKALYRRAINEANGLTNYVDDRPELRGAEKRISAIEAEARAVLAASEPK